MSLDSDGVDVSGADEYAVPPRRVYRGDSAPSSAPRSPEKRVRRRLGTEMDAAIRVIDDPGRCRREPPGMACDSAPEAAGPRQSSAGVRPPRILSETLVRGGHWAPRPR